MDENNQTRLNLLRCRTQSTASTSAVSRFIPTTTLWSFSCEPQHMLDWSITGKLSLLISSHTCAQQISRHRVAVVRALAVNMGWHVNQCSCHVGTGPLEERGHAAGLVVTSPDGARSVYDTVFVLLLLLLLLRFLTFSMII